MKITIDKIHLEYQTTSSNSVPPTGGMVIATVGGKRIMFEIAPQLAAQVAMLVWPSAVEEANAESEPPR